MKTNGVVHFEIYARDAEKLAKFYSSLFDWTIEAMPGMDYRYVKTVETDAQGMPTKPGGINGGLIVRPAGFEDQAGSTTSTSSRSIRPSSVRRIWAQR